MKTLVTGAAVRAALAGIRGTRKVLEFFGLIVERPVYNNYDCNVDDLMALADAVGATAPTQAELDAQELREYHLAMCEAVERFAAARATVMMFDFRDWEKELVAEDGAR